MSSGALLYDSISPEDIAKLFSAGSKNQDRKITAAPASSKHACYFCLKKPEFPNRLWLVTVAGQVETPGKYLGKPSSEQYGICSSCYVEKQSSLN